MDVTRPEDLQRLLDVCDGAPAIYFALPPAVMVSTLPELIESAEQPILQPRPGQRQRPCWSKAMSP